MSDKTVEQIDAEIKKLQDARAEVVRLNEAKKPKHGDYGFDREARRICLRNSHYSELRTFGIDNNAASPITAIKGNIFDDLEAAGCDGILLPLTKEEALEFMDHRLGDTYTFGPNFDKLNKRIEAKLK